MKKLLLGLFICHLVFFGFAFKKAFGATPAYYGVKTSTATGKATGYISGSWNIAGSSQTASTSTIVLDGADGILKYDTDGTQTFAMSSGTITGLDGNPIYYKSRYYPRDSVSGEEQASIYLKVDPSGSTTNQQIGIFGEITAEQQDTEAALLKVVHKGAGDAIYVPMYTNSGVAFEAASFGNGTKGIISTLQTADCFYTTLFSGLWAQDTVPGYGAVYLDDMPGNAITIKRRSGSTNNQGTLRVVSSDLATEYFKVTNEGSVVSLSTVAAVAVNTGQGNNKLYPMNQSVQTVDSPVFSTMTLSGNYFSVGSSMLAVSAGKIGMGTATPETKLHLYESAANTDLIMKLDGSAFSSGTHFRSYRFYNGGTEKAAFQYKYSSGTETFEFGTASGVRLDMYTSGTVRASISADGKFGMGTTAPSQKLHISSGTIHIDGSGAPTYGGALCLNANGNMSKCTSAVDASGNCTCP